jgi:hypothetical protein
MNAAVHTITKIYDHKGHEGEQSQDKPFYFVALGDLVWLWILIFLEKDNDPREVKLDANPPEPEAGQLLPRVLAFLIDVLDGGLVDHQVR